MAEESDMANDEIHDDGVFFEDEVWVAYVDGVMVACGPDKPIIEAAFKHHNEEDFG